MTPKKSYESALKGIFDGESEKVIAKSPKYATLFAKNVLNARFPLGEKAIASTIETALEYTYFIGERFEEAELTLSDSEEAWTKYRNFLSSKGIMVFNDEVNAKLAYEVLEKAIQSGASFDAYKGIYEDTIYKSAKYSYLFAVNFSQMRLNQHAEALLQEEENKKYWNLYVKYLQSMGYGKIRKEKIASWKLRDAYNNAKWCGNDEYRAAKYEKIIRQSAKYSYYYAKDIHGKRTVPATIEDAIAKSARYSMEYAYCIQKRFEKGERLIARDRSLAQRYVRHIIKARWEECEPCMRLNINEWFNYLSILREFGVTQDEILSLSEREKNEIDSSYHALLYAKRIIKGRWIEGEPLIMKDLENAYSYVIFVKERIEAVEDLICKNARMSSNYAIEVLGSKPFEKGEPAISKEGWYAWDYIKTVKKCRWEEAEPAIKKVGYWDEYVGFLKEIDDTFEDWEAIQKQYDDLNKQYISIQKQRDELKAKLDRRNGRESRAGRILELH